MWCCQAVTHSGTNHTVFNLCQRNEEGVRRLREKGKPVSCQRLQKWHLLRLYSEVGGGKFLRSIGIKLPKHPASHLRRKLSWNVCENNKDNSFCKISEGHELYYLTSWTAVMCCSDVWIGIILTDKFHSLFVLTFCWGCLVTVWYMRVGVHWVGRGEVRDNF